MRPDLMEILCCPVCKGDLALETTRAEGTEIIEGMLRCQKCKNTYPIQDGIPDLLPPDERD
ncbi:MAG: methytransferase partner Trm112 [Thermoplasmata archaeon]